MYVYKHTYCIHWFLNVFMQRLKGPWEIFHKFVDFGQCMTFSRELFESFKGLNDGQDV